MNKYSLTMTVLLFAAVSMPVSAGSIETAMMDWQIKQLFQPGKYRDSLEKQGRVFIYAGMKSSMVMKALDEHFDRIQSMMFTGTVVTDKKGTPLRDQETGRLVVEDDGC
jgi:hypothetical protein